VIDPAAAPPGVPWVAATNRTGRRSATAHLAALGHHRIAVLAGPADLPPCRQRLDGYRAAMAEAGLAVPRSTCE
jgi:LacI family transcriptional regulator, galactose operon repressor